jgi:hypothetical protein
MKHNSRVCNEREEKKNEEEEEEDEGKGIMQTIMS